MRPFLVALLALLALAAPAQASTVSVQDGTLRFVDEVGEMDDFDLGPGPIPGSYALYDYAGSARPGTGCTLFPDPYSIVSIVCPEVTEGIDVQAGGEPDFTFVFTDDDIPVKLHGGDGDDYLFAESSGADELDGGPGNDRLQAGLGADRLLGGEGDDHLTGDYGEYQEEIMIDLPRLPRVPLPQREGEHETEHETPGDPDVLDGGPGDDRLEGGGGADALNGGLGKDSVSYEGRSDPVVVTLDGAAGDGIAGEDDTVGADVEVVLAGSGADTLRGGAGDETFEGGAGNDTIDGGAGQDLVTAGEGDDNVRTRDGATTDSVECGDGRDSATIDPGDQVDDCESVDPPPGAPASSGTGRVVPQALALRAKARRSRLTFRGRLVLPAGADARSCAGAPVAIELRGKGVRRTLAAVLGADCSFRARAKVKRRRALTARATFGGTQLLAAAQSRPLKVRARR